MLGVSGAQSLAVLLLGGGAAATVMTLVTAYRKWRAGQSEDIAGAIERQAKRQVALEKERDAYARDASRYRRLLVKHGIDPQEDG